MKSKVLILIVSVIALVLILIGISGSISTDSISTESDSFESSNVEFPSGWGNLNSTNETFLQYGYDRTFICTIQIIDRDTYYSTIGQGAEKDLNYVIETGVLTIEGVNVKYQNYTVFKTTDLKIINSYTEMYLFQKNGKFYSVRFDYYRRNDTGDGLTNSSRALFDETVKSIIKTI